MPKYCKNAWLGFLVFGILTKASAQSPDLQIEKQFFVSPEVIFLSDFNITQSGSSTPFFRVTLRNRSNETKQVVLSFKLVSRKNSDTPIVEAQTWSFPLDPNKPISITNLDITQNTHPAIRLNFFHYNQQIAKDLQDAILRSGRLPNDIYDFVLKLEESGVPSNFNELVETIRITNPTKIDLLGPGRIVGQGDYQEIFTSQPQFQWQSNANEFILTVCELLPTNSSPEDVMQNEPRAKLTLRRGHDFVGSPAIVYPSVGVWPLVEGKTYYWQVHAVVEATGEKILLPSEIWGFRVAKFNDVGQQIIHRSIMTALIRILSGTPYTKILDPNGPLKDFRATGVIYLNGRRINAADLNLFIAKFASRNAEIVDVSVE